AIPGIKVKNTAAATTIQWLDDHFAAMLLHKVLELLHITGYKRLWNLLRETKRIEFFVGLPQSARVIHYKTFLIVYQTEKVSRKEKLHVEGRILAHEQNVKVLKGTGFEFPEAIMGCPASDMKSTRTRTGSPAPNEQVVKFHIVDFMIPLLRLE